MHAEKLYAGIRPGATLMSDGYEVYNGIAKAGGLTPWGWVHARRPFIKAADAIPMAARSQDQVASRFLQLIAKLYRAEALAKDWAPNRRVRLRSRYSRAVVREFERLLLANLHRVAPSSLLGETLHYLHGQWSELVRFLGSSRATGLQPRRRTPSGRSSSEEAVGCSPAPWAVPTPALTCTR